MKNLIPPSMMPLVSGALSAVSIMYQWTFVTFFCLIPLFYSIVTFPKSAIKTGSGFGITLSAFLFWWIIEGAGRFTGSGLFTSVLAYLLATTLFAFFWTIVVYLIARVHNSLTKKSPYIIRGLYIAALWTSAEFLLSYMAKGFPWVGYQIGLGLSNNLYAIQPAAIFGVSILSFFVVSINYILTWQVKQKNFSRLWIPVAFVGSYFLWGVLILKSYESDLQVTKTIRAALLTQNIDPETNWNESNGNSLANEIIGMSRQAAMSDPDIMVWTESIIPWTYSSNDDLLNEIEKVSGDPVHYIGMNTAQADGVVMNSVYQLNSKDRSLNRYDKQQALYLMEKPFAGLMLPFISSNRFEVSEGENNHPLPSPVGYAGILICNESAIPSLAKELAEGGADFFINMSNDGWFADSYLADVHFFNARLRAVENRKDIIINSNRGFCGLVRSSGRIDKMYRSRSARVEMVDLFIY